VYRFLEFTRLLVSKADLAREAQDFKETRERAEAKGDKALALLDSPECSPDPALVAKLRKDFEVRK
jgi:hypothetical protein